jgi:selenocysteine lyase/cysteine desulfurase
MTTHDLNGLRISLSVFNTEDQVEVLIAALREIAG